MQQRKGTGPNYLKTSDGHGGDGPDWTEKGPKELASRTRWGRADGDSRLGPLTSLCRHRVDLKERQGPEKVRSSPNWPGRVRGRD